MQGYVVEIEGRCGCGEGERQRDASLRDRVWASRPAMAGDDSGARVHGGQSIPAVNALGKPVPPLFAGTG